MLNKALARSLMRIVPEKRTAVVTLNPGESGEETVTVTQAWFKPITGGLRDYAHVGIQVDETIINIPDHELNPAANGRQMRQGDRILIEGDTYQLTRSGSTLTTLRTVWRCVCQKILPSV